VKIVQSVSSCELIQNVLKVLIAELSPFDEVYDERRYSISPCVPMMRAFVLKRLPSNRPH